jgi:hypothetical protein
MEKQLFKKSPKSEYVMLRVMLCISTLCELISVKFKWFDFFPDTECFSNVDIDMFINELSSS